MKTEASQSGAEYKEKQDITAPPDPIEPGSTSDVPIHGEKTNVLFHPTPSVSYEPTFARLEKQAGVACIVIMVAIIVLGKYFGGSLKGLIPLGACITSGVWLWMKEVVRSGREVEWDSEKERGKTVSSRLRYILATTDLDMIGDAESPPRVRRMDEHSFAGRLGPNQPRYVRCSGRYA